MTIDEFEKWLISYLKSSPTTMVKRIGRYNISDYIDLLQYCMNIHPNIPIQKIENYTRGRAAELLKLNSVLQPIRKNLSKVEPKEDQAFLTLKYSEYLK
jgi:hypothetical protein